MKKILLIVSILLAAFGLFGCESAVEPAADVSEPISQKEITRWDEIVQRNELRIGVPSTNPSFDNELIDAFSEELEITVTKIEIPWNENRLDYLKEQRVDMLWGQIPATSDTSTAFRLSTPYFNSTILYISKNPDLVLEQATMVGVIKNSAEEATVQGYYTTVLTYPNQEELLYALNTGTCDMIVYDKVLYEQCSQTEGLHIVKEVPYELVVAFEQNNVSVCTEVEKTLAKTKADGTASEICVKWYLQDLITK